MFDFEKLEVYKKAKAVNKKVLQLIKNKKGLNSAVRNQLTRASMSVVLNLAEGSARFGKKEKRNFYVISRSSAYECVAILDILKDDNEISETDFRSFYEAFEEVSRILYALIQGLTEK